MSLLPVERAHRLALQPPEQRWLIESLWGDQAVGILGGEPKCGKSFLALDIAVAVAAGKPCLRRFPARRPGRVLLYAAEDAHPVVRQRLEGIAAAAAVELCDLDIHVITAPTLRLDLEHDRRRLTETVAGLKPTLLILDPFVRLHRVDENVSGDVAPLLAFLRELQRRFALAILVVHHARKSAAARAGQALRGSSEFHAWGDSNLYLSRRGDDLTLQVEHRAAPSIPALRLQLAAQEGGASLVTIDEPTSPAQPDCQPPPDLIRRALQATGGPLSRAELRAACRMRAQTFSGALRALVAAGAVIRSAAGYSLAAAPERLRDEPRLHL